MKFRILLFLGLQLLFSCSGKRNLVYFSETDKAYNEDKIESSKIIEPLISSGDIFSITVTSLNPVADVPFNRTATINATSLSTTSDEGYLVDENGYIDFPVLKAVKIGGLTKLQAKTLLTELLLKYLSDPIVTIRYLNYRITVIGEVSNPSSFPVPSERINILEAIGLAGDLTVYGKRDNVLIIKEKEGIRKTIQLNLTDRNVLNSPNFYLEPNDVVYIEPVKSRKDQASLTRNNITLFLAIISTASLIFLNFVR